LPPQDKFDNSDINIGSSSSVSCFLSIVKELSEVSSSDIIADGMSQSRTSDLPSLSMAAEPSPKHFGCHEFKAQRPADLPFDV
jgi:hypothetical protein